MLYRIITEDKEPQSRYDQATELFNRLGIKGATVSRARGVWRGQWENSLIIEIAGTEADRSKVWALAQAIKQANKQEAVLMQVFSCESQLV